MRHGGFVMLHSMENDCSVSSSSAFLLAYAFNWAPLKYFKGTSRSERLVFSSRKFSPSYIFLSHKRDFLSLPLKV